MPLAAAVQDDGRGAAGQGARPALGLTALEASGALRELRVRPKRSGSFTCPSFTPVSGDREIRLTLTGGPRVDRRQYVRAPAALAAYQERRAELEEGRMGYEVTLAAEVGRTTGVFGGVGLRLGTFKSSYAILGEPVTVVQTEQRLNDAGEVIGIDTNTFVRIDRTLVPNRQRTASVVLSGGYRYALGPAALYLAADVSYAFVTSASGTTLGVDGGHRAYASELDDWVNRRPGVAVGGRLGADIDLSRSLAGDPGRLALLLEVSARNTGVFAGADDPLSYRYSRYGASTGLRYTF